MSTLSISSSVSSSSDISNDSSELELNINKINNNSEYSRAHLKLNELIIKGNSEKMKLIENKKKNIESRKKFIEQKEIEKKNIVKPTNTKMEKSKKKNEDKTKKCMNCKKTIKEKNFFYHDAFIHNGENLNFIQKKRALKTYITKKMKKIDIIFSDIMRNAKRLKIDSIKYPELIHIEKIGYHALNFKKKNGKK